MSYPEPKYHGANGEVSAVLHHADQPYDLEMGKGGTQVHYLATGAACPQISRSGQSVQFRQFGDGCASFVGEQDRLAGGAGQAASAWL